MSLWDLARAFLAPAVPSFYPRAFHHTLSPSPLPSPLPAGSVSPERRCWTMAGGCRRRQGDEGWWDALADAIPRRRCRGAHAVLLHVPWLWIPWGLIPPNGMSRSRVLGCPQFECPGSWALPFPAVKSRRGNVHAPLIQHPLNLVTVASDPRICSVLSNPIPLREGSHHNVGSQRSVRIPS